MLSSMKEWMQRHHMVDPGDRVIVAVSGGPDSVALLHSLHRMAPGLALTLHVFHMDHGLRGEASAEDALYVRGLAETLGLPSTVIGLGPEVLKRQSGSLQANARAARYGEIEALARRISAHKVATGHNRDDQAETVLMRLLRGAGTQGLSGIPPVRRDESGVTYIRPLLNTPRSIIDSYCMKHGLTPRMDLSNAKLDYLRNQIRLELLPYLARAYNPAIASSLANTADVLREEDLYMADQAVVAYQRCRLPEPNVLLQTSTLLAEPTAIARRVVRLAAREATGADYELGLSAVTTVLEAARQRSGTCSLDLPGGLRVDIAYGTCCFSGTTDGEPTILPARWAVNLDGETEIPELAMRLITRIGGDPPASSHVALDFDRLPGPLHIRLRRPGDRIWPAGMDGSKKLQDILVDAKVPRRQRDGVPLLAAGESLLWVIGHRVDRRYLAAADSARSLYVQVLPLDDTV